VRVCVDETRHHRHATEIDVVLADAGWRAASHRGDASAIDGDPSIADRRFADGQDPGGVIADYRVLASLPARLRAG